MAEVFIRINGVEEIAENLSKFSDIAERHLGIAMGNSVIKVAFDAKNLAPFKTGFLRNNIKPSVNKKRFLIIGKVRSAARYSVYQEFGCFLSKHVSILTKRGWTDLQNVKVGDLVLTHKNNWKKVTKIHTFNKDKNINLKDCINLKTKSGYNIIVTGNHPIMTCKGWVRADKLKQSDLVQIVYNDMPHFHYSNFTENPPKYHNINFNFYKKERDHVSTSIKIRNLKFRFDKIKSIRKFNWGTRPCYNLSVEDDESFISNHIVTHNTSHHSANPFMLPAFNQNKEFIQQNLGKGLIEAMFEAESKRRIFSRGLI